MRSVLGLSAVIVALLTPIARAQGPTVDTCATDPGTTCPIEQKLPDLHLIATDPVVTGSGDLRFLATSVDGELTLVDLSPADGAVVRVQPLDHQVNLQETWNQPFAVLSPDGQTLAIHGDAATEFLFLAANGARLGQLKDSTLERDFLSAEMIYQNSGYEADGAQVLQLLLAQGIVVLGSDGFNGSFYRFDLTGQFADGSVKVGETRPAMTGDDTLAAYLGRRLASQLDPVGQEEIRQQGMLMAVSREASDGAPARLSVRAQDGIGSEVFFDQHLGTHNKDYGAARLSADGRRLAVVRLDHGTPDLPAQLMVFDVATTMPVLVADLPAGESAWLDQIAWLSDDRIAVLRPAGTSGTHVFGFDLPTRE